MHSLLASKTKHFTLLSAAASRFPHTYIHAKYRRKISAFWLGNHSPAYCLKTTPIKVSFLFSNESFFKKFYFGYFLYFLSSDSYLKKKSLEWKKDWRRNYNFSRLSKFQLMLWFNECGLFISTVCKNSSHFKSQWAGK